MHLFATLGVTLIAAAPVPTTELPRVGLTLDSSVLCAGDPVMAEVFLKNSTAQTVFVGKELGGRFGNCYFEVRRAGDRTVRVLHPGRFDDFCGSFTPPVTLKPRESRTAYEMLVDSEPAEFSRHVGKHEVRAVARFRGPSAPDSNYRPGSPILYYSKWMDYEVVARTEADDKLLAPHSKLLGRTMLDGLALYPQQVAQLKALSVHVTKSNYRKHAAGVAAVSDVWSSKKGDAATADSVLERIAALPDPISRERYRVAAALQYAERSEADFAKKLRPKAPNRSSDSLSLDGLLLSIEKYKR